MGAKHLAHLAAIEKTTLTLAAVVIAAAWLTLAGRTAMSASLGAGLMALNAYALRKIGDRVGPTGREQDRPRAGLLLFNLKMAALLGLVFICIRYLHVDPVAFLIGVSIFPVAIVIVAIRRAVAPEEHSVNENEAREDTHG